MGGSNLSKVLKTTTMHVKMQKILSFEETNTEDFIFFVWVKLSNRMLKYDRYN